MSELGESIFDAFNFLNKFLKDVSKLITTVEEKLTNKHLIALGDAATFWDHSRAYYAPGQWMPKYIIRHYTEGIDLESKKHWKVPWLIFFVIYLYPARFQQPVAVWGSIVQDEMKNMSKILYKSELYTQNPQFLTVVPANEWITVGEFSKSLSSFKYQSTWLTDLNDSGTIDVNVIQPLLEEANGKLRT